MRTTSTRVLSGVRVSSGASKPRDCTPGIRSLLSSLGWRSCRPRGGVARAAGSSTRRTSIAHHEQDREPLRSRRRLGQGCRCSARPPDSHRGDRPLRIPRRAPGLMARLVPALRWLPRYDRRWLRGDVIAGVAVTALDRAEEPRLRRHRRRPAAERPLRRGRRRDHLRALLHVAAHLDRAELVAGRRRGRRGARDRPRRTEAARARRGDHARDRGPVPAVRRASGWAGSRSSSRRRWSRASSPAPPSTS